MDLLLKKKRVVITGGASGIGWAAAKEFLAEGASVVVWDLQPIRESSMIELDPDQKSRIQSCKVDITQESSIHVAKEKTLELLSGIDHLVHAAAIGSGKFGFPFTNLLPTDWIKTIEVNVLGTVNVCHAISPILREQGDGSICIIGSVAGQMGSQTDPPYSASKAANINFAQCMAKDLAAFGVRVNVVNPGMVQTPLNRSVWQAWHDSQPLVSQLSYEAWAGEKVRKVIPMGRWQTVEEIASMVVYLASSRARNITGQCINVDGGFVMHS